MEQRNPATSVQTGVAVIQTGTLTTTAVYELVDVLLAGANPCVQDATGTATVTVIPLPTATISGTTSICYGGSTAITFNATPNSAVNYKINHGVAQSISIGVSGTAEISTGDLLATTSYELVDVTLSGANSCTQDVTGSATVTVIPLPTASISGTASICYGGSTTLTVHATPNSEVRYKINNGAAQTLAIGTTGNATTATGDLNVSTTYELIDVTLTGANPMYPIHKWKCPSNGNPITNSDHYWNNFDLFRY